MAKPIIQDKTLAWAEADGGTGAPSTMDEDLVTEAVQVSGCDAFAMQFAHDTGSSPVGAFYIQGSIDGTTYSNLKYIDGTDVTVAVPITGGAAMLRIDRTGFKYARGFFDFTSGTATATAVPVYGTGEPT